MTVPLKLKGRRVASKTSTTHVERGQAHLGLVKLV